MKKIKHTKMSEAAKQRISGIKRDNTGKFVKKSATTHVVTDPNPVTPPKPNANFSSQFVSIPNPVQEIFYNPDEAWNTNPENANRMIQDMAIYASLQERQLATASLPWQIVPQDENDKEQQYAADCIEDIIRSYMPNLSDYFRNLLDAIWFGRSACYNDYQWNFKSGKRQMVPVGWTPVHGDSLVFADDGRVGYRVGVGPYGGPVVVGVTGMAVMVDEDPIVTEDEDGKHWLAPAEREAWVVHHYTKVAAEFYNFTQAAGIYGLGLRSRIYPIWLLKQSCLQFMLQAAEKFGAGWVIGYFDAGNPASAEAVKEALQKQIGSCTQMFPRYSPDATAIEGMEVIDPPTGGVESLFKIIDYYDDQIRKVICSQTLTADNKGGTGLGSSLAQIHQSTFGRLIKYDSAALEETLSDQLVAILQQYNGFDHLPPLRFEFSFDLGDAKEKLEKAKMLYEMGIKLDPAELIAAAGFTVPKHDPLPYNEEGNIDTTGLKKEEDSEHQNSVIKEEGEVND